MADTPLDDQDAIAAQWEASLDSEDPAEAAAAAAANELSGTMALQWAAMVEDGSRDFGGGKNGGERVLSQEEIDNLLGFSVGEVNLDDHSGIRAIIDFGNGLLRAPADARNRLRPAGAVDDDVVTQFHFR